MAVGRKKACGRRIGGSLAAVCLAVFLCFSVAAEPSKADRLPSVSAESAVLYEPSGRRVLYEKRAHEKRAMASTTKLMTALVGAEALNLDETVTVTEQAVRVEGSSLGLAAGDRLRFGDLITGMLLASGNDAANAVALSVAPSIPAFAALMNRKAAELGMKNTSFVTPSGLDAADHYATAYDMALLGAAVLERDDLRAICRQKQARVSVAEPARTLYVRNHNRLLSLYPEAIGLKTGFTKKAGRCLVSAAERDGVTLVAVTLNAPGDWQDHRLLFEYGFSCVERVTLPAVTLPAVPVAGGSRETVAVVAAVPEQVVREKSAETVTVRRELPPLLVAPVKAGTAVGRVVYAAGDTVLAVVPVTAAETVMERERSLAGQRFGRMFQNLCEALL